jgi:hypothetical protein
MLTELGGGSSSRMTKDSVERLKTSTIKGCKTNYPKTRLRGCKFQLAVKMLLYRNELALDIGVTVHAGV